MNDPFIIIMYIVKDLKNILKLYKQQFKKKFFKLTLINVSLWSLIVSLLFKLNLLIRYFDLIELKVFVHKNIKDTCIYLRYIIDQTLKL